MFSASTKYELLTVCRAFHDVLLPELYAVIPVPTYTQLAYLLRTLQQSKQHARLVQNMTQRLDLCMRDRFGHVPTQKLAISALCTFLKMTSGNLPRLEHFTFNCPLFPYSASIFVDGDNPLVIAMTDFLAALPVRSLDFRDSSYGLGFPLPAIPTLQAIQLSHTRTRYMACLPGNLPSLSCATLEDIDEDKHLDYLSNFIQGFDTNLTSLKVSARVGFDLLYKWIVTSCPQLRQLVVSSWCIEHSWYPDLAYYATTSPEPLPLERIGIEDYRMVPLSAGPWETILLFALRCFQRTKPQSAKTLQFIPSIFVLEDDDGLRALDMYIKQLDELGVFIDGP